MAQAVRPETTIETSRCAKCSRGLRDGWSFVFAVKAETGGPAANDGRVAAPKCLLCSLRHWPMIKKSLMAAVVVGTLLTLLNQGDFLISGNWNPALYWKIPLTYCVPFVVATYGALSNVRK